jgi:hypothetical protein
MDSVFDSDRTPQSDCPHWVLFETIEDDLHEYSRYLEFHRDNFQAFSVNFVRLYLSICSEIDVVLKLLCERIDPAAQRKNIDDYRKTIVAKFPNFHRVRVWIRPLNCVASPWKAWSKGENPSWWRSYNQVKHERNRYFRDANLRNVLESSTALLVVLLFWHPMEVSEGWLGPNMKMFGFETDMWFLIRQGAHLFATDLTTVRLAPRYPSRDDRRLKQTLPNL